MPADFADVALPHLDAAYNLARWLVRDPAMAEDVVQDSMVRALTYFSSYRGDGARAWVLRIVRTTAYTRLSERQGRRWVETALDGDALDVADLGPGPEAAMAGLEGTEAVGRALDALPVDLRECLVLRELEEMSYAEIARVTEIPIGTVMSRLWRARAMLTRMRVEV